MSDADIPTHVPAHLVHYFDFRNDPRLGADPWTVLHELNARPDIFYSPALGGFWVVTRESLIGEVLRRSDLFSTRSTSIPKQPADAPRMVLIPNNLDPPEHAKYRKVLALKMFSPRALETLEPDARRLSRRLLDAVVERGECDFVSAFSRPLPVDLFLHMMCLPAARRDEFVQWTQWAYTSNTSPKGILAFTSVYRLLSEWVDRSMAKPAEQDEGLVFPAMREASIDGRPLTKDEMLSIAVMLFLAGLDTVSATMNHVMLFLAQNPDLRRTLVAEPERIPDAIEEFLRRFGIVHTGRVATGDFEFNGVQFKEGDAVLCSTAIAGLDEKTFRGSLDVDIDRKERRDHSAFGAGRHLCPAAYLARVELRVMLEELLPRLPNLRLSENSRVEYYSNLVVSLKSLPLKWDVGVSEKITRREATRAQQPEASTV